MNYKKVMLIGQFFIYALINPVSILSLIAGRFIEFPSYFTNFFELLWQPAVLYVWMVLIYAIVILLNYLIFKLKIYVTHKKRVSCNHFLTLYFRSQEIYWWWAFIMIFPAIVVGFFAYIMGGGTAIVLVLFMYPFHMPIFKIAYLIFGCSLMILSHRTYVKLARGEKVKNSY